MSELVPRYLRHLVNAPDRQLPGGPAFRIGEQDDRCRSERRDHGPLRGCRRPQRRTDLVFRSGSAKAIQPGSWIVNCTGYFKSDDRPYEPYVSPSGAVLSIQPRSATLQLTSIMAYFMTHLLMLGKIRDIPLYELDAMDLRNKSNAAFPFTLFTLALYNLSLISDASRPRCFHCGIDSIAGIRCHAAWWTRHGSCSRTAANASISAAPSTPCANGSTFGAAR